MAFDPLSIDWHAAFWADDPGWAPPTDGGAVSQWDDASGNASHASQATVAKQPTFRASVAAFGGRSAIEFDGSDDSLAATFSSTITGVRY